MGDRVQYQVVEHGVPASCSVYLHWGGDDAIELLKGAIPRMVRGDGDYSAARLIGHLHEQTPGRMGLGVCPPFESMPPDEDEGPGDAGVVFYDCFTGMATFYDGYLADKYPDGLQLDVPPD